MLVVPTIALMALVGSAVMADFSAVEDRPAPPPHRDGGRHHNGLGIAAQLSIGGLTIQYSTTPQPQLVVIGGVLCVAIPGPCGMQFVPYNPGNFNPAAGYQQFGGSYGNNFGGYGAYGNVGYGGNTNAAYTEGYQQTLRQLQQQAQSRLEDQARQAGQRAAEQHFNQWGWR